MILITTTKYCQIKKYDEKKTYKKNKVYIPWVETINDKVVYLEIRDGNVKFE